MENKYSNKKKSLLSQSSEFKSKLWILHPFGKQQPPGPVGQILKNDFCQQAFFNGGKHAEFWVGVLVQNPTTYLAQKGFSALHFDIKTSKRSCVLNETLNDLMRGAIERDVMPNWNEISGNI